MKYQSRYAPKDLDLDSSAVKIERRVMLIGDIIRLLESKRFNFQTDFQRQANLWSNEQQSRLIESIFLNLPLPSFYFEYNSDSSQFTVVDGLQRLYALYSFIILKDIRLQGLDFLKEYEGYRWDDLTFYDQMKITSTEIVCYMIDGDASNDVKYIIFNRLNTGGTPLKPQEIRTALFPRETRDVLSPMVSVPEFIKLGISTKRKLDMEFALRFLSFYLTDYHDYPGKMDYFLNSTMERLRNLDAVEINRIINIFCESLNIINEILGDNAFRQLSGNGQRKPISKTLFETLTVAVAKNFDLISNLDFHSFRKQYEELLSDKSFKSALSNGTGDKKSVITRFSKIEQLFITNKNKR